MYDILLESSMTILLQQSCRDKELLLSLTLTLIYEGKYTRISFTRGDAIVIHVEKEVY